ncbi:toprim domain-containing protein [Trichocoleus sp. Lan]|uniref:VapE domain-containing protein n=1 Tax=Trichocoleus sp. Lan TaxID=2933927 RepID=UPI0032979C8A
MSKSPSTTVRIKSAPVSPDNQRKGAAKEHPKTKSAQSIDLVQILESEVYPRLSPEKIYSWGGHNFQRGSNCLRGNPPWGDSKSGTSFAVFEDLHFLDSHNGKESGDPIKYLYSQKVRRYENPRGQDWIDTVKELFSLAGVPFPEREWNPAQIKQAQRRETRQAILKAVEDYCADILWTPRGDAQRKHLIEERGFTEAGLKDLGIGVYTSTKEIKEVLQAKGLDLELAQQIGVLSKKWEGYITFPWANSYGQPLTIYGHQSKTWADATGNPKKYALFNPKDKSGEWLHTKESPYLLNRAIRARHKELILVEGITDAAIAHQQGDTRVVACAAAMLSKEQVQTLMRQKIERVIIALDPDEAGKAGIGSCIKRLLDVGISPYVAPQLSDGLDPDEFILKYGIEGWNAHIAEAKHAFTWTAEQIIASGDLSSDKGKEDILNQSRCFARNLKDDPNVELFFWSVIAKALDMDTKTFRKKLEEQWKVPDEFIDPDIPQSKSKTKYRHSVIERHWGNHLRLNELKNIIELDGKPLELDTIAIQLGIELDEDIPKEQAIAICTVIAKANSYNPVKDYLENCLRKHAPIDIDNLATRWFGTSDDLSNIYLKRYLIGAVARIYQPGCQNDTSLILQGKQGFKKSTFFRVLHQGSKVRESHETWFDDTMSDVSNKDERDKLHRFWCLEWSELERVLRRGDDVVKAFLTSKSDTYRPPYGREPITKLRQSVIVGTTNRDEFLSDDSGDRRFWTIKIERRIDSEQIESERDRVWASAVAAYKAGEQWHLSDEEQALSAIANSEFHMSDAWEKYVLDYVRNLPQVTTAEILQNALDLDKSRQDKPSQMRVGVIMKRWGWERRKMNWQGSRLNGWVPTCSTVQPVRPCPTLDNEVGQPSNDATPMFSDFAVQPVQPFSQNFSQKEATPQKDIFNQSAQTEGVSTIVVGQVGQCESEAIESNGFEGVQPSVQPDVQPQNEAQEVGQDEIEGGDVECAVEEVESSTQLSLGVEAEKPLVEVVEFQIFDTVAGRESYNANYAMHGYVQEVQPGKVLVRWAEREGKPGLEAEWYKVSELRLIEWDGICNG